VRKAKPRVVRKAVPAAEFKAHCLRILDDVAAGQEITITKRGKPVARLGPVTARKTSYGSWKGLVHVHGDIVHADWSRDFDATQ
jgi:prevent-host-death family protein